MEDLDFSQPPTPPVKPAIAPKIPEVEVSPYDPKLALKFFKIAGETESFAAGTRIFAEQDKPGSGFFSKGARVYLLLEGQVALTLKGKPLNLVLPGETFGEIAVISDVPRSATATANKNCRVLSLDEKRFLSSLQQEPGFALMLISMMTQQLQRGVARLLASKQPLPPREGGRGLDQGILGEFRQAMGDPIPTSMKTGDALVSKGALGVCMFVVTEGEVSIALNGQVVERIGPGGVFGETALLGPTSRAATVTAESDGAWIPVSRDAFLRMVKARPAIGIALLRSMSERLQHIGSLLGG